MDMDESGSLLDVENDTMETTLEDENQGNQPISPKV